MKQTKKSAKALSELHYDLFTPAIISTTEQEIVGIDSQTENKSDKSLPSLVELYQMYNKINDRYFGGKLPQTRIMYSERMLIAGTFTPIKNEIRIGRKYHQLFPDDIEDTLKHEMIHIINLNHDANFKRIAQKIGASLKAKSHPQLRGSYKYLYYCPTCGTEYPRRKRLRMAYCGICSKGRNFDPWFKLKLMESKAAKK
jgi:predicted SprT family Zn-dependent metalloprotease